MSLVMIAFVVSVITGYGGAVQTNDVKIAFHAADTNQDGKITVHEFKQYVKQEGFKNIDRDGDKKIDSHEWKAAAPSPGQDSNFEAVDKDRDKTVSFLEFSERLDKNYNYNEVFNSLDRNRDGSLAPDEFNARPAFNILSVKF
jgi:Ca2+-binding EF-hand superfamily protein